MENINIDDFYNKDKDPLSPPKVAMRVYSFTNKLKFNKDFTVKQLEDEIESKVLELRKEVWAEEHNTVKEIEVSFYPAYPKNWWHHLKKTLNLKWGLKLHITHRVEEIKRTIPVIVSECFKFPEIMKNEAFYKFFNLIPNINPEEMKENYPKKEKKNREERT